MKVIGFLIMLIMFLTGFEVVSRIEKIRKSKILPFIIGVLMAVLGVIIIRVVIRE